nr:c-type cytochrome [Verticiella sediminum]
MLALAAWIPCTHAEERIDDGMRERVAACTACHGAEGRAGADGYYPRIAGKPADYLYHQLLNFRDGRRQYAPMTWLLVNLPDDYLREIAQYFAGLHPPYAANPRTQAPAAQLARGEALVRDGVPGRPACAACHGADLAGIAPAIPGLLGLPRDYLLAQIGAWQGGTRATPAPDCMATVARALSPEDVAAVAAWLASQPLPAGYAARTAPDHPLPIACHGVPQPVATEAGP